MRLCYLLALCYFSLTVSFSQPIIRVTPSGTGDGSGSSWSNALSGTLLAGNVATATPGTQFWIAAGTYYPTTTGDRAASFSIASGVQVYGGFAGSETALTERINGTNQTIFSGDIYKTPFLSNDNSTHVMTIQNANQLIIINSVTISGGYINGFDYGSSGGSGTGLYINQTIPISLSIAVTNCSFISNQTESTLYSGGAIIARVDNFAEIILSITDSYFSNNKAGFGGAYAPYRVNSGSVSTQIENCLFVNNNGQNGGGAIDHRSLSTNPLNMLTIKRCKFINNTAGFNGGSISLGHNQTRISECIFSFNQSTSGGAVDGSGASNAIFTNCVFSYNEAYRGGAIYSTSENSITKLIFKNCTFSNNIASISGGAFYSVFFTASQPSPFDFNQNDTILENCIVWQNTAPDSPVYKDQYWISFESDRIKNSFLPTYSNIQEIYPGAGNIDTDPQFADPRFTDASPSNYYLQPNSPAINAGDPDTAGLLATDLAGQPRVQNGRVDMGAYEFGCIPAGCPPISAQRIR